MLLFDMAATVATAQAFTNKTSFEGAVLRWTANSLAEGAGERFGFREAPRWYGAVAMGLTGYFSTNSCDDQVDAF